MKAFSFIVLSTLFLGALASPVEKRDDPLIPPQPPFPPKDKTYIKDVTYGGDGCPPGSVSSSIATDRSNINLFFSKYTATCAKGLSLKDSRKACFLNIELVYPYGWSYAIYSTQYRGFVQLDKKVTAAQKSTYWFSGEKSKMEFSSQWVGDGVSPISTEGIGFDFTDDIARPALVWSPCGPKVSTSLVIETEIKCSNKLSKKQEGYGTITNDYINHKVTHKYGFYWRRC